MATNELRYPRSRTLVIRCALVILSIACSLAPARSGAVQRHAWQARCLNVDGGTDEDVVYASDRPGVDNACKAVVEHSVVYGVKEVPCDLGLPGCPCAGFVLRPVGGVTAYFDTASAVTLCNGSRFVLQADGNLVLYRADGTPIWATWTYGHAARFLAMQGDGNLVLYGTDGGVIWSTGTDGHPGTLLAVQEDNNIVLYDTAQRVIWSSRTAGK